MRLRRYRVYILNSDELLPHGEVYTMDNRRSSVIFVSDIAKEEIEMLRGVFKVVKL